ncbi:pilus assembly protein CpaC [Caulobacter segnis]|uniref:CpaC-related secretion pathway protein n=2 Tax=Caulobacter segnis TaxID=88688 RepID=D5VN05_CAUST|nr:pilus assembly protein N-terminal domain-containing protein [Caulobacter segnis]ADG11878.1 CpaC-related secretion pathway protein [Caulobacter segnis ATCC 21756]AVQ03510.1 pilus assembly protein CpaC [Caulobacter segnis]
MRRFSFTLAALLVAWNVDAAAQSRPAALPLATGQAISLSLGGAMRDVVVGDPEVADVSIVNERTLVVLGKRPGVTNLLVFGAGGRALTDRQLIVSEAGGAAVTVYRGVTTSNYACPRECARLAPPAAGASPP